MSLKRSMAFACENEMNEITNFKKIRVESVAGLHQYDECLFDTVFLNNVSSSIENLIGKFHDLIHECAMKRVDAQLFGIIMYWCRDLLVSLTTD